ALAALVLVDERVGHDPEQPRLAVGVLLERIPEPIRAQQRVLDQVLGVARVARQAVRRAEQSVAVHERLALELSPLFSYGQHSLFSTVRHTPIVPQKPFDPTPTQNTANSMPWLGGEILG